MLIEKMCYLLWFKKIPLRQMFNFDAPINKLILLTLDPEKDGCESTSDKRICQLRLHIANKKIVISDVFG